MDALEKSKKNTNYVNETHFSFPGRPFEIGKKEVLSEELDDPLCK